MTLSTTQDPVILERRQTLQQVFLEVPNKAIKTNISIRTFTSVSYCKATLNVFLIMAYYFRTVKHKSQWLISTPFLNMQKCKSKCLTLIVGFISVPSNIFGPSQQTIKSNKIFRHTYRKQSAMILHISF